MIYWVHELAHGPNWKLAADTQGYAVTQFGSAHFKVKLINSSVYMVVRTLRGEIVADSQCLCLSLYG